MQHHLLIGTWHESDAFCDFILFSEPSWSYLVALIGVMILCSDASTTTYILEALLTTDFFLHFEEGILAFSLPFPLSFHVC
jgi:hypothetical protein